MPFLGRDWRSDGAIWVKTVHGWETLKDCRQKVHGNINFNAIQRLLRQSIDQNQAILECPQRQLSIYIPQASSARFLNSELMFTEAIKALDMPGALKDQRKSAYVYKLMELLIDQLPVLSCAVRQQLFAMLQSALSSVCDTGYSCRPLLSLLERLKASLINNKYCFTRVGSSSLWTKHYDEAEKMLSTIANSSTAKQSLKYEGITLPDLPSEVLRHILHYLSSHEDLLNAGKITPEIQAFVSDGSLWKDLCFYHFSKNHVQKALERERCNSDKDLVWYRVYWKLFRQQGHREGYADMLDQCCGCSLVYWRLAGHGCKCAHSASAPLTPSAFVVIFL